MKIVIIVPCYNEHETIEIYYNEVIKHINDGNDYNILFINDGSKDNSLEIMKSLAEKDERVLYLSFSRNFGKEAAMYAGLHRFSDSQSSSPCSAPKLHWEFHARVQLNLQMH